MKNLIVLCLLFVSEIIFAATPIGGTHIASTPCRNGRYAVVCPPGQELPNASFGPQSSNKNVLWDFDFVEEFDGLADWAPAITRTGNVHYGASSLPNLANGTDSAWDYFSYWSYVQNAATWIGAYGDNRVWRGTKAATIDLGETDLGPSRLGFYMGAGYQNLYVFFMVNIPKTQYPTSCTRDGLPVECKSSALGVYTEGDPYTSFLTKFNTFNWGCTQAGCPDANTYGLWDIIIGPKQYNYGAAPGLTMRYEPKDPSTGDWASNAYDKWGTDSASNLDSLLGDWMGVEYHIEVISNVVHISQWIYDEDGTYVQNMNDYQVPLPLVAQGTQLNEFFIGGNVSASFVFGPTMTSSYTVDDVIVDDKRIGPKYFSLIGVQQ